MIPVLSKHDAFTLDESTISSAYLTEKELMDNAGKVIAQFIVENIQDPFNQKYTLIHIYSVFSHLCPTDIIFYLNN